MNKMMFTRVLTVFLFAFLVGWVFTGHAQVSERQARLQNQIYQSFVRGNIPLWEATLTEMERNYNSNKTSSLLYDLLLARYGFVAFNMEVDKSKARTHLDKAEDELEQLFQYPSYQSNAWSLKGAFYGFRISLRPISAVTLGPRSYSAINEAVEADRNNPVAWMEMGNTRFYTPSAFGGSKQEALEYYQKAVNLFEKNMPANQKWLYLNSLVGLAKSYQATDNKQMAINTYKKALTFEPEFKWVRDELLPELLK
jgi:tetratricopeptide (TPR) repeat protein